MTFLSVVILACQVTGYVIKESVLFIEVSSFQGVLIRGVPAVLFIEVSSFQGVLNTDFPLYLISPHYKNKGMCTRKDHTQTC